MCAGIVDRLSDEVFDAGLPQQPKVKYIGRACCGNMHLSAYGDRVLANCPEHGTFAVDHEEGLILIGPYHG